MSKTTTMFYESYYLYCYNFWSVDIRALYQGHFDDKKTPSPDIDQQGIFL